MEQVDYTEIIPVQPPEGFRHWVFQQLKDEPEYLVYRADRYRDPLTGESEKAVKCRCTSCGGSSQLSYVPAPSCAKACAPAPFGFFNPATGKDVISGNNTVCPVCGNAVKAIHISNIHKDGSPVSKYYPMTIERHNDKLMLIGWYIARLLHKDGSIITEIKPYEAYIAEYKKIIKLVGYGWGGYGSMLLSDEWRQLTRYSDTWKSIYFDDIYPWNPDILIETSAENCKLDIYLNSLKRSDAAYPVTYLHMWIRHRNVENLVMSGAARLVNSFIEPLTKYKREVESINNIKAIDWKKKKPHEMLGLTKPEYKDVARLGLCADEFKYYMNTKTHGVTLQTLRKTMKVIPDYYLNDIENIEQNYSRAARYIIKQREKYPDITPVSPIGILTDYWGMARDRGYNLNDMNIRYPQNLVRSHDNLANEIEYEQNKEKEKQFTERFNELYRYSYSTDDFEIHPARSPEEMVHEGKILHHCVGSYVNKHAQGKTAIFFIRRRSIPDKPYFTLELNVQTLSVLQNRGLRNCARTKEIEEFEAEWLKYIKMPESQSIKNAEELQ